MLEELLSRLRTGDRLALARVISLVASGQQIPEILAGLPARGAPARVVALTGSAGVGKSTLAGRLIEHVRQQDLSIAVLACDPESPLTGGALLGDRHRMPARPHDAGTFIRSLAAGSGYGAVARHLRAVIQVVESFGFDVVLVETVGAGQADTAVRDLADVVVVLLQPETGDDVQWEKAGLLEIADIIAIHKADLPQAENLEAHVRTILGLSNKPPVPVIRVSAKTGTGVGELWTAITQGGRTRPRADHAQDLLRIAQARLGEWFRRWQASADPQYQRIVNLWHGREISTDMALARLAALMEEQAHAPLPA